MMTISQVILMLAAGMDAASAISIRGRSNASARWAWRNVFGFPSCFACCLPRPRPRHFKPEHPLSALDNKHNDADLRQAFEMFDLDGNGFISMDEARNLMKDFGHDHTEVEMRSLIDEYDTNKDHKLDFKEFCGLMNDGVVMQSGLLIPSNLLTKSQFANADDETVAQLKKAFNIYDENGNGEIEKDETLNMVKKMGYEDVDENDIKEMFEHIDLNGNGVIDFEEFCHLMLSSDLMDPDEHRQIFNHFAPSLCGRGISREDVNRMMKKVGEDLSDAELDEMMRVADLNGDGVVDFDEFCQVMGWTEAPEVEESSVVLDGTAII